MDQDEAQTGESGGPDLTAQQNQNTSWSCRTSCPASTSFELRLPPCSPAPPRCALPFISTSFKQKKAKVRQPSNLQLGKVDSPPPHPPFPSSPAEGAEW